MMASTLRFASSKDDGEGRMSANRLATCPACQPRGPAIADFVIVRPGADKAGRDQAAEMRSEPHQIHAAVRRCRRAPRRPAHQGYNNLPGSEGAARGEAS